MRWQDCLFLLLLLGAYLVYFVKRRGGTKARRIRRSGSRLGRREQEAWRRLQARGYRLGEIHPSLAVTITVDGKKKPHTHEGGFIVSKGGKTYLVRVKRGDGSTLSSPALRHELLLDYFLFQPHGMLLYEAEREKFQELGFAIEGEGGGGGKEGVLWRAALVVLIVAGSLFLIQLVF